MSEKRLGKAQYYFSEFASTSQRRSGLTDLVVYYTPNLTITTVADKVRFISNLKLSPR
ncbi:TPA: hypothetical protein ACGO0F_000399 [Streptococcus suis]